MLLAYGYTFVGKEEFLVYPRSEAGGLPAHMTSFRASQVGPRLGIATDPGEFSLSLSPSLSI